MALKPCRECKKKVSTEASACPNCGVPNPTKVTKTKKLKPNYGYARCEKNFCNSRYKLLEIPITLIGAQTCQACGNTLSKVKTEDALKDIERKKSSTSNISNQGLTSSVYQKSKSVGMYESFMKGFYHKGYKEGDLAGVFWGFFILGNIILNAISLISDADWFVILIRIVWVLFNILSVLVVFTTADQYKRHRISKGQDYTWATPSKVASVVLILSAIGNAL